MMILPTRKVVQNSQEYLLGIFKVQDILKFTRYTEYTILGFDEDNLPITNKQVQRKLNSAKVNSIVNFLLNDPQAIFPTNIVISIPNHVINFYEETDNEVNIGLKTIVEEDIKKLDNNDSSGNIHLSIIDGQHRIRGIEQAIKQLNQQIEENANSGNLEKWEILLDNLTNMEMSVSFFIDPVLEYQAMIFSTINRTQTKVNQDLVYSLFGLTEEDSPQKTALNIVNVLNGFSKSPFFKRIRLAGASSKEGKNYYKDGYPILSQATMVKSILFMITPNTDAEIERHKPRKYFARNKNKGLLFREYYGENKDHMILQIINTYFSAIRSVFVSNTGISYWEMKDKKNRPTNILQTSVGYEALLKILEKILAVHVNDKDRIDPQIYISYLSKAKSMDIEDNNDPKKYPFTTKTKSKFIYDISKLIFGQA